MSPPAASATFDLPFEIEVERVASAHAVSGRDPSTVVARDGVWRATRTPEGPATLWLSRPDPGSVEARCWGPGAEWLLRGVPGLLGFDDDRAGFDATGHAVVAEVARRRPGHRIGRTRAVVEALVPTILGQRVTAGEAARSYRSLVRLFGEPAPGPADIPLPPDPRRLARLAPFQFHRLGVEAKRASAVISVCRRAASLERLVARPAADAGTALRSVPGLGPWTVAITLGLAWGDPDAVVVGDYHMPHAVAWHLAGEARATDERMLELLAPFAGHRGRAQRLVLSLGGAPRRGPRQRIQPLARL